MRQVKHQSFEENTLITHGIDWVIFIGEWLYSKEVFSSERRSFVEAAFLPSRTFLEQARRVYADSDLPIGLSHHGLAYTEHSFAEGAERIVFQCSEVVSCDDGVNAVRVGPRLVAKETKFTQLLGQVDFHLTFCRTQAEAEELARLFNRRLQGGDPWQVSGLSFWLRPTRC